MYKVLIVLVGSPGKGQEVLRATHTQELEIEWREPRFLEVRYEQALVHSFTN